MAAAAELSAAALFFIMGWQRANKRPIFIWIKAALLLALFGLALTSLRDKAPTFDEQGFLTRGVGYLRGENQHLRVGHPLGLNGLNGLFLAFDKQVLLPTDDPSWQGSNFHRPSELFLWEIGNDVSRVMFLGRLPSLWLGMLLVAVAARWAQELTANVIGGVVAMILLVFDPNIMAHTRLATTDLGLAAAALLAGYLLWRFWKRPSWLRAGLAGGSFGILLNTKFTAGLFIPLFALVILIAFLDRWRRINEGELAHEPRWRPLLMLIVCYPLIGFLVLWAAYGFQVGTLPANLPAFPQLSGLTLPLAHYLEQLLDIGGRLQKSTPSFLLGQYSEDGWWYYFPVVFLLKTPLPILILLGWAFSRLVIGWLRPARKLKSLATLDLAGVLVPAIGYFGFALTTEINLGYRHLLPILPYLYIFIAAMLVGRLQPVGTREWAMSLPRLVLVVLLGWLVALSLWIYPHYLAYFNVLAGGPNGGWRALVDSNLDWGQDLPGLKPWMEENDVQQVWLSYFGEARPAYYGINYRGLNSFPPRLANPEAQPFYPFDPAPGTYAISATTLQGVHFSDHDYFAWFRDREPIAKIGYSLFLYQVPARGEPAELALGGLQLDEIASQDYAEFSGNEVTPHWFDPAQSLLLPQSEGSWLVLKQGIELPAGLASKIDGWELVRETAEYRLYRRSQVVDYEKQGVLAEFRQADDQISLLAASYSPGQLSAGETLEVVTQWSKAAPPQPIKIFIHLTDEAGEIASQWDGLGAPWEGWRDQDILWQSHQLHLAEELAPGNYQLWAGLYEPESGQRWQTATGDRTYLGEIVVE